MAFAVKVDLRGLAHERAVDEQARTMAEVDGVDAQLDRARGEPRASEHEIGIGQTVTVGGIDWRDCADECDRAGEVELQVTSTYWVE